MAISLQQELENKPQANLGVEMHRWIANLFPYHRSQTGAGVRQTLADLQAVLPVQIHEVPTGTQVFDWQVPPEWQIRDAYIADSAGKQIVNLRNSNLAVMSGSQPIQTNLSSQELRENLHTLPADANPDWVPYRTAFFREAWGFCVSRNQLARLTRDPSERFDVVIDSEFVDGSLTYGEATFVGKSDKTILIYAHCCHPSLANDNLSGMVVAAFLGQQLAERIARGDIPKKTYKIVFAPATIGAITWLAENQKSLSNIESGLILSLLGDEGSFTFKQSRCESTVNRAVAWATKHHPNKCEIRPFTPFGYDERQFCSPGINLPMGCLMRTPNGEFPEYHTSADNLDFVSPEELAESLHFVTEILTILEENETLINQHPFCEPQLGDRGLYRAFGQHDDRGRFQEAVMWVLNLADGNHDLLAIAERGNLPMSLICEAADVLREHKILEAVEL